MDSAGTPATPDLARGTWRRLLVPLDGTPVSEQVLALVAPIARDAEVVHLLRIVSTTGPERAAQVEDATRYLERTASALVARGAKGRIEPLVRCGDPALSILETADATCPDVIAMATHGQTSAGRAYGSVAGQVVRRCPFPTLVVDPLRHRAEGRAVRRILVPFDGSSAAASCLPLVALAARSFGARVDLVHVGAGPTGTGAAELEPHRLALVGAAVEAHALVVARGSKAIAARLLEEIERADADLVIVPTGGREGVVRWALGPVGEGVLRGCRRPVLIRPVTREAAAPPPDPRAGEPDGGR